MGCGVSKLDGVPEPRPMQSHGRDKVQLTGKLGASKPIQVASVPDPATCMSPLHISPSVAINNPASPPSVWNMRTPGSLSSDEDESDLDSRYEFPSNLSIKELEGNASRTTALAALSGEKTRTDEEDVEKRVEAKLAADGVLSIEHNREYSTCPLGMLSGAVVFQDRIGTGPVITEQRLDGGLLQARVGRVAVIAKSEPIRLEDPLQRAEIIDLDGSCSCVPSPSLRIMGQEEPDVGEVLLLENTHEKQGDQSDHEERPHPPQVAEPANLAAPAVPDNDQENSDQESAPPLTEQPKQQELQLHDATDTNKILPGPDPQKAKLPPLTIVPPIPNACGKPALPVAVKQDLLEVKLPAVSEAEQIEDPSARTPDLAAIDSANANNHNTSKSSPVTEQCETPTHATNSPADSEWRSLHRNTPDLDIEHIVLLDSQELDMSPDRPPLVPTLDCQGKHMDMQDLISPSLRLT